MLINSAQLGQMATIRDGIVQAFWESQSSIVNFFLKYEHICYSNNMNYMDFETTLIFIMSNSTEYSHYFVAD